MRFYEDGIAPTKNLTAMQDAMRTIAEAAAPMEEDGVDAAAAEDQLKKGKVRLRHPSLYTVRGGMSRPTLSDPPSVLATRQKYPFAGLGYKP